ncbi:MAG TPA: hypothetical protein VKF42_08900 [Chitinivibrionales bacterium]|nr:hypothetical protein [Chitinivibrionales bacterium]
MTRICRAIAAAIPTLLVLLPAGPSAQPVGKYAVFFGSCTVPGDSAPCMAMRSFARSGRRFLLTVDLSTLATRVVDRDSVTCEHATLSSLRKRYGLTPYVLALDSAERRSALELDAGIVHGLSRENGIDLTADLCPSKLPLARKFFTDLLDRFLPEEKPVPIALAVTGNWMYDHQEDLRWLKALQDSGELNITWINHSYNHRWADSLPIAKNFLEIKGTNLDVEVLKTERKMLEYGITPSVFFRFPGLVSDSMLFVKITAYGLIPVGSDAWLAKNQSPHNGSIVLVHANGNEPYGIKRFFDLVRAHRDSILAGKWLLYDLRESIVSETVPASGGR